MAERSALQTLWMLTRIIHEGLFRWRDWCVERYRPYGGPLRANKRETIDWLKFTLEGVGERTHGYAFTDTPFAGCWI